jgi:hypothetical protein
MKISPHVSVVGVRSGRGSEGTREEREREGGREREREGVGRDRDGGLIRRGESSSDS